MRLVVAIVVLLLGAFASESTAQLTWRIEADGTGSAPTIQQAIDQAGPGDTILLAPGTFTGPGNQDLDLQAKEILLTSEQGADTAVIIPGGFPARAFVFDSGETTATVVSDITIQGGKVGTGGDGGAILCTNASSPRIQDCVFRNNTAGKGGAIACYENSAPVVTGCEFMGNGAAEGGAIYLRGSSANLEDSLFYDNAASSGGAILAEQGGLPLIRRCTLVANSATTGGGFLSRSVNAQIVNSIVALSPSGAGMTCEGISAVVVTCSLFFGNAGGDAVCGIDAGDNLFVDPQFCGSPGSGNYKLQSDSPCAPANNSCAAVIGAMEVDCSSVSTRPVTWGRWKSRFGAP